jgi:preprotein translocase subunit YajC
MNLLSGWLTTGFSGFLLIPSQGEGQSFLPTLILIALMFAIFYFLLIAPARKKQKRLQEMINNLKNGDRVVTTGGMYGTVVGISEQIIQLRIAEKVKIDISKSAVAGLVKEDKVGQA